jgi:hypothetical protein
MMRRQEFQSIKTHEFVFQDTSGSFPEIDAVMVVSTDKGITKFTRDLSLNTLYASVAKIDNIVIGSQSAVFVDVSSSTAYFNVLTVDSSASFLGNIIYNNEVLAGNIASTENDMVAVGPTGSGISSIRTSVNGSYWINASGDVFGEEGNGVAWNGCMWVAVGKNSVGNDANTIAYSANGVNWKFASGGFLQYGKGVAWNGSYWIAVGTDGVYNGRTILTSKNGVSWTNATTQILFQTLDPNKGYGSAIAWNGAYWVATGYDYENQSKSIYTSKNGSDWILGNSPGGDPLFSPGGNSIAWGNNIWITVGDNGSTSNVYGIKSGIEEITPSVDNIIFTQIPSPYFTGTNRAIGNGIGWNGYRWIIVANNGIYYSDDYNTWIYVVGQTRNFSWKCITWNGASWAAAGSAGIWMSPDGITWSTTDGVSGVTNGISSRKILPNSGYILPKNIPASRNTVDASGMDTVSVSDVNVQKHSVILLTVRIPRSNKFPVNSPGIYNQGRAYVYSKIVGTGFSITSYEYDYSTYDYAIIN